MGAVADTIFSIFPVFVGHGLQAEMGDVFFVRKIFVNKLSPQKSHMTAFWLMWRKWADLCVHTISFIGWVGLSA